MTPTAGERQEGRELEAWVRKAAKPVRAVRLTEEMWRGTEPCPDGVTPIKMDTATRHFAVASPELDSGECKYANIGDWLVVDWQGLRHVDTDDFFRAGYEPVAPSPAASEVEALVDALIEDAAILRHAAQYDSAYRVGPTAAGQGAERLELAARLLSRMAPREEAIGYVVVTKSRLAHTSVFSRKDAERVLWSLVWRGHVATLNAVVPVPLPDPPSEEET